MCADDVAGADGIVGAGAVMGGITGGGSEPPASMAAWIAGGSGAGADTGAGAAADVGAGAATGTNAGAGADGPLILLIPPRPSVVAGLVPVAGVTEPAGPPRPPDPGGKNAGDAFGCAATDAGIPAMVIVANNLTTRAHVRPCAMADSPETASATNPISRGI